MTESRPSSDEIEIRLSEVVALNALCDSLLEAGNEWRAMKKRLAQKLITDEAVIDESGSH
jgi:hypothetical protein